MITGSLAGVAHKIDRITKKRSDIVLLLSKRLPSANAYWALEHPPPPFAPFTRFGAVRKM